MYICILSYIYTYIHIYIYICIYVYYLFVFEQVYVYEFVDLLKPCLHTRAIFLIVRSSHQRCSVRKGVLRNLAKFTGKRLRPGTLLKKRFWHRCFPVNIAKFLRTLFFTEHH